ncbi:MAG: light-inducible protein [Alphaproteobacteria bacterium]|nr:light-inducible protein [Alphaproteobacteria bacterium]
MPLLALQITEDVTDPSGLMKALSDALASATNKPEAYCMVTLVKAGGVMGGSPGALAYGDVKAIGGFKPDLCQRLSASICSILTDKAGIREDRVYLTFSDIPASHWGWNRGTFG